MLVTSFMMGVTMIVHGHFFAGDIPEVYNTLLYLSTHTVHCINYFSPYLFPPLLSLSLSLSLYIDTTLIPYSQKFLAGENFCHFCHMVLNFLSCVNVYIEHMVTFIVLVKIYSIEYFCNTKVTELSKFLSSKNFRLYGVSSFVVDPPVLI